MSNNPYLQFSPEWYLWQQMMDYETTAKGHQTAADQSLACVVELRNKAQEFREAIEAITKSKEAAPKP